MLQRGPTLYKQGICLYWSYWMWMIYTPCWNKIQTAKFPNKPTTFCGRDHQTLCRPRGITVTVRHRLDTKFSLWLQIWVYSMNGYVWGAQGRFYWEWSICALVLRVIELWPENEIRMLWSVWLQQRDTASSNLPVAERWVFLREFQCFDFEKFIVSLPILRIAIYLVTEFRAQSTLSIF